MSSKEVLENKVGHPSPSRDQVSSWIVAAILALPPVLFSVQVIVSFATASIGCTRNNLPSPALILFNIACIALLALTFMFALRAGRQVRSERSEEVRDLHDKGRGRTAFLLQFGLLMSGLFVIASLVEMIGILILGSCAGFVPSL